MFLFCILCSARSVFDGSLRAAPETSLAGVCWNVLASSTHSSRTRAAAMCNIVPTNRFFRLSTYRGSGKGRATEAATAAISSPLLDFPIERARGVVFNVVGGEDLTLQEVC